MTSQSRSGVAQYREEQRFTQWWLLLIIAGSALMMFYAMFHQFILGEPFGNNPGPDWLLAIIGIVVGVGLPVWFFYLRLVVEVRADGLHYKFFGLHRRWHHYRWDQIAHFYPRDYKAIREYGGWGIRLGFSGKAYNVKGTQGLQLVLQGGEKVLFGSQNPSRLVQAIEAAAGRSRSQPESKP
ncbi:MAG: DUF6141 family protein [bacterium]